MPEQSLFKYEVKYCKKLPKFLTGGLKQAEKYKSGDDRLNNGIPILVVKERYMHGALVVLWLKDWKDLHGESHI